MIYLDDKFIADHFTYSEFIPILKNFFCKPIFVPPRPHYAIEVEGNKEAYLLLMPAWMTGQIMGVKLSNVFPGNARKGLPSVQGTYTLMSALDGSWLCQIDAVALTRLRTAASSALASSFLSRKGSKNMLMIGTGALCPELIAAHCSIRDINEVYIWGRNFDKAKLKADTVRIKGVRIHALENKEEVMNNIDLISCATLSEQSLISGHDVYPGTHIDLVGSFLPHTREADDELIEKATVYIDTESAKTESGDILIPLQSGVLKEADIRGNLTELCLGNCQGRSSESQITLFKSVGYALEDLACANYLYQKYIKINK